MSATLENEAIATAEKRGHQVDTTPGYAPRGARRKFEETLALAAAARGWHREVERHRCTSRRIENLLAGLTTRIEARPDFLEMRRT